MKKKRAVAGGLLLVLGIAQSVSAGTTTVTSPVKLANPVRNSGTEGSTLTEVSAKTLTTHISSATIMKTNLFILLRF